MALLNTSAEMGLRPESSANMIAVTSTDKVTKDRTPTGKVDIREARVDRLSQHLGILVQ